MKTSNKIVAFYSKYFPIVGSSIKGIFHFFWTILLFSTFIYLLFLAVFELPPYLIKYFNKNTPPKTTVSCIDSLSNKLKPIPAFSEYPISEIYSGEPAKLDEGSSFIAKRFRSYFIDSLNGGVNFAGHYAVAEWGFTGIGSEMSIVDLKTGKAYVLPYIAELSFSYRKDSNLLIIDPIESICSNNGTGSGKDISEVKPYYYIWQNDSFKLLNSQDGQPGIDKENLVP